MNDEMPRIDILKSLRCDQFAIWLNWEFGKCEWCLPEKWLPENNDCSDENCMNCIIKWLKEKESKTDFIKRMIEDSEDAKKELEETI